MARTLAQGSPSGDLCQWKSRNDGTDGAFPTLGAPHSLAGRAWTEARDGVQDGARECVAVGMHDGEKCPAPRVARFLLSLRAL
jgi:hypothetical protein